MITALQHHTSDQRGQLSFEHLRIIGIVAAVVLLLGVPIYLRSRVSANQTGVVTDLEQIVIAQRGFFANTSNSSYAALDTLFSPEHAGSGYTPAERRALQDGLRYGYIYQIRLVRREDGTLGYDLAAMPRKYARTGVLSFYTNESGTIRAKKNGGQPVGPDAPLYRQ